MTREAGSATRPAVFGNSFSRMALLREFADVAACTEDVGAESVAAAAAAGLAA